jgi:hypothetical protein
MWKVELRPEIRRGLKDPDTFARGMEKVYTGLIICMCGVVIMLILYFSKPEHVLRPAWILGLGFATIAWGEWQKYRSK